MLSRVSAALEGIDEVAPCRLSDLGLQCGIIDDIDPARKQLCDSPLEPGELEDIETIGCIDLDEDIEIAASVRFAARNGAENSGTADTASLELGCMPAEYTQRVGPGDHDAHDRKLSQHRQFRLNGRYPIAGWMPV